MLIKYLEFHNLRIENERFDAAAGSPNDQSFGIYYQSFKPKTLKVLIKSGPVRSNSRFSDFTWVRGV